IKGTVESALANSFAKATDLAAAVNGTAMNAETTEIPENENEMLLPPNIPASTQTSMLQESVMISKTLSLSPTGKPATIQSSVKTISPAGTSTPEERPNSYYPIYYDEKHKVFSLEKIDGYLEIFPIDKLGKKRVWRQTRPSFLEAVKRGDMVCKKSNGKYVIYMKDRIKEGRKPKTIWTESKYDASA
ncbi:MAG: hypothetical protein AAGU75_23910, partial [Bacillota bacterium]